MKTIESEKIPIKMWLDEIEPGVAKQVRNIANLSNAFHHIAIMPDAHVGYGMPIGGVLATKEIIVPNAVGVDIGCGMIIVKTSLTKISKEELKEILGRLREIIPIGFNHHKKPQDWDGFTRAPDIPIIQQELSSSRKQIGTLGGGNHFMEVLEEVSEAKWEIKGENYIWLMLHSGSRNFGLKVANVYHKKARQFCEGSKMELPDKDLAFLKLDSRLGQEYWQAMNYCQEFAQASRSLMMERFMVIVNNITGCDFIDFSKQYNQAGIDNKPYFGIHHNFASKEEHFGQKVIVHRKGATQAFAGQLGIVPGSMGTPSYIVEGLGNPESFMSCSHGAGRQMSRRQANKEISEQEANKATSGVVFGRWHGKFDEAPQAYKDIERVIEQQKDLARPIVKLKPLAVIIGG